MKKNRLFLGVLLVSLSYGQYSHAQSSAIDNLEFGPQNEDRGAPLDRIVAVVEGDVITEQELANIPQEERANALQRLIMQKLLMQQAERANISVGDTAINIAMQAYAESRETTLEALQAELSQTEYANLRARVTDNLIIERLQQQVVNSLVQISEREVEDVIENQLRSVGEQVNLVDILIEVPESADPEVLRQAQEKTQRILKRLENESPEAVAADYPDVFYNPLGWVALSVIPPSFSKVLINQPTGEFAPPIIDRDGIHLLKILARRSENELVANGEQADEAAKEKAAAESAETADTNAPENNQETRAAHILIRDENNPEAQAQIEAVYQRLQNGEDFAELARALSEDLTSAAKGGDLGWVVPGQMVPEFQAAMDALAPNTISKPIKTPFGYHIIQVSERRTMTIDNQAMLEQQARQAIFQRKAGQEWEMWLSRLRDEAYIDIRLPQ